MLLSAGVMVPDWGSVVFPTTVASGVYSVVCGLGSAAWDRDCVSSNAGSALVGAALLSAESIVSGDGTVWTSTGSVV